MYLKYHRYLELNRLVGAAVVSKRFRRMLLRNPERVLEHGYLGYQFSLSAEEAALVKRAAAVDDIREFSLRVWEWMNRNDRGGGSHLGERSPQTGLPFEDAFASAPASMAPVSVARVEGIAPRSSTSEPEPASWDWRIAMKPLILVVENNREMAYGLRFALEMEGFQVALAFDGEAAVKFLKQRQPDLILADIKMPRMDGYALLRAVKGHIEWHGVPFVFVTAAADWRQAVMAKTMGADEYIVKPFELEDLIRIVKRLTKAAEKAEINPADELDGEANRGH
jgi:CheY-like chemotaxis protein